MSRATTKRDARLLARDDLKMAAHCFALAAAHSRLWDATFSAALKLYGDHGPLISGCGRDHFPHTVKEDLRSVAHAVTTFNDAAMLHRPRGVRLATMHDLARAIVRRDGGGHYGYRV